MTLHVALFKWKPDIKKEAINKLIADIQSLKEKIPEIIEIYAGENFSKWAKEYTHAVIVKTKSREDLEAYRTHPEHQPIAKLCDEFEVDSIGFDFES